MPRNKLEVYIHLVWATWDRQPQISPTIEQALYRILEFEAQKCGCVVLAMNGLTDHIHALLKFPATITISDLVKQMKGVSSKVLNADYSWNEPFRWQGCYGAFSISLSEVEEVKQYIQQQKARHTENQLRVDLEECSIYEDKK